MFSLLIVILEHELYPGTVQAFINAYPLMKSKGWDTRSIPQLFGDNFYQNSVSDNSTVYAQNLVVNATNTVSGLATSGITSATSTTAGATGTGGSTTITSSSSTTSTKTSSANLRSYTNGLLLSLFVLLGTAHSLTFP